MIFPLAAAAGPAGGSVAIALLVILAMAALITTLGRRLRLTEIPAYLIAGALAGPHVLGLVQRPDDVEQIANLAIILLMFGIGLSLDIGEVGKGLSHIVAIGMASTLVVVGVCFAVCSAFGMPGPHAIIIAMAVSISSTAVLVRTLQQRRELRWQHGRAALGVSIVQDLFSVLMLAIIPVIARSAAPTVLGTAPSSDAHGLGFHTAPAELLLRGAISIGGLSALMLIAKFVLPLILKEVARVGTGELLIVTAAAIALAFGIGASVLGFSPEMGAFLAGFSLAATPYRFQLSGQIAPMRDLLMAIFFTVIGMKVDPSLLSTHWWSIPLAVVGITVAKWFAIGGIGWLAGMSPPASVLAGAYLATAGEFTLVILGAGAAAGILDPGTYGAGVIIVIFSLVCSPILVKAAHRLSGRAQAWPLAGLFDAQGLRDAPEPGAAPSAPAQSVPTPAPTVGGETRDAEPQRSDPAPDQALPAPRPLHVVIAGFGPVGRALAESFEKHGMTYTVVDLNPRTVIRQGGLGRSIVYGDVTNPDVLERAGVADADAICLTIPDGDAVLRACGAIRHLAPGVFIAARTNFLSQALRARSLGADHVIVEEIATAAAMEREIIEQLRRRARPRLTPGRLPDPSTS